MSYKVKKLTIIFMDGEVRKYERVGGYTPDSTLDNGVLHVYYQGEEHRYPVHIGSFPVVNIRSYHFESR
jgi:hypothetical protein